MVADMLAYKQQYLCRKHPDVEASHTLSSSLSERRGTAETSVAALSSSSMTLWQQRTYFTQLILATVTTHTHSWINRQTHTSTDTGTDTPVIVMQNTHKYKHPGICAQTCTPHTHTHTHTYTVDTHIFA